MQQARDEADLRTEVGQLRREASDAVAAVHLALGLLPPPDCRHSVACIASPEPEAHDGPAPVGAAAAQLGSAVRRLIAAFKVSCLLSGVLLRTASRMESRQSHTTHRMPGTPALQGAAAGCAPSAAPPLPASAGAWGSPASLVHRLSSRTAQLTQSNTQLREERDHLKVLTATCWRLI